MKSWVFQVQLQITFCVLGPLNNNLKKVKIKEKSETAVGEKLEALNS